MPLAEHPGGFPEMQNGAVQVMLRTPKVADFHVLNEMTRVHRRDPSGLGSIFDGKVFNGRRDGARVAQNLRLRRGDFWGIRWVVIPARKRRLSSPAAPPAVGFFMYKVMGGSLGLLDFEEPAKRAVMDHADTADLDVVEFPGPHESI